MVPTVSADSGAGAHQDRVAGRGAGAGEHKPLRIGCRRGEWIRISGATVKLKVKNTFASEFLLFGMKSCEL